MSRAERWRPRLSALPAAMQATVVRGLLRCLDFQGASYAERFLRDAEALSSAAGRDAGRIAVAEDGARSLALWMCFEDIIRVADLKPRLGGTLSFSARAVGRGRAVPVRARRDLRRAVHRAGSGVIGSAGTLVIGLLRGRLHWPQIRAALINALRVSSAIMLIVVDAYLFGYFLTITQFTQNAVDLLVHLPVGPYGVLALVMLGYLVLGAVMPGLIE